MRLTLTTATMIIGIFLAIGAWGYKRYAFASAQTEKRQLAQEISDVTEAIALKKTWRPNDVSIQIKKLRQAAGGAKKWEKKGKKIVASFENIEIKSVDQVLTRLMRMPVVIEHVSVRSGNKGYDVEIVCKLL